MRLVPGKNRGALSVRLQASKAVGLDATCPSGTKNQPRDRFEPITRAQLYSQTAPASVSAGGYSEPGFQARLDATTGSFARGQNNVELLFDGKTSFAARRAMIDGAESSIHLQTFIFEDDETGWDMAKRLAAKAKEGVDVRVIVDGIGSGRADDELFDYMRDAGVDVREYGSKLQFWDWNDRWHEKHLIVDGEASIEGGMNIADEYAFGGSGRRLRGSDRQSAEPWRDVDVKLTGPAVHDTQAAFLKNWSDLGGKLSLGQREALFPRPLKCKADDVRVRVVQQRPDDDGDVDVNALMNASIDQAKGSIRIENAYFLPRR